jgi:hypothetical protein
MRVFAILLALTALYGCATPNEIRAKGAAKEFSSQRPAQEVAICIADRWDNAPPMERGGTVSTSLKSDGYTVTLTAAMPFVGVHAALLADIKTAEGGSRIAYYSNDALVIERHYRTSVAECAAM